MSSTIRNRWLTVTITVAALSLPTVVAASTFSNATQRHAGPAGAVSATTRVGHAAAPRHITIKPSATQHTPTKAQLAARAKAMAGLAKHLAPSAGTHTGKTDVRTSGGPQTTPLVQQAPTDFNLLRSSLINSTCSGCGQASVNEPAVANNGRVILETSNWNIAYVTQGGSTLHWKNQDPYALSSGFCCDQEVTYDPERDVFLLLQLDYASEGAATNGLTLSVTKGRSPTAWCSYHFAGAIGGGTTDTPDFPKIGLSSNNAYVSWNDYPPNAAFTQSGMARFPLDSLAACSSFSYNFLTRNSEFTFSPATAGSSLDTFYWVSNWFMDGTTNGSNLRIFSWPENSAGYTATTRAINAFNFTTVGCGGSPDWCSRLDARYESPVITRAEYRGQANASFAGDTLLEVAGTAGPSGFSGGKNYVVYNYFKLNTLGYIGNEQTYSTGTNFAYPGCAVNNHGYVGCSMQTGTTAPGGMILLQDNVSPSQPWAYNFAVASLSPTDGGGDYTVTSPWNPGVGPFQTVLWNANGSTVQPYYLVWGRTRDRTGYLRWKNV